MSTGLRVIGCVLAVVIGLGAPGALGAGPPATPSPQDAVPAGAVVLDEFTDSPAAPGEQIATYAGWLAWSHRDASTGDYALVVRDPAGHVSLPDIRERGLPFDVNIGPTAYGRVVAVYSVCADVSLRTACRIVELKLGDPTAKPLTLRPPGGGSVYAPALDGHRLAFLRVEPNGGAAHPQAMFEWDISSRHLEALRLPRNAYAPAAVKADPGLRATDGATGQITWLHLTGNRVAYTRVAHVGDFTTSDAWLQSPGGAPQLIDRQNTGLSSTGVRTYLNPLISGSLFYSFRQYSDIGWSFVRYSLARHAADEAQIKFSRIGYYRVDSAVAYRSGAAWSISSGQASENGTTLILLNPSVEWQAIPRPHAAHLPDYY
jgi:hypothetical protein